MDDRARFFERPSPAEKAADARARRRRKDEDAWAAKVLAAKRERQAEIEEAARTANPKGPWWGVSSDTGAEP